MSDTQQRLVQCFQAVFPDLDERDVVNASSSRVGGWDSLATVTLVAVVEEEFGVQFDASELEKMDSFQRFRDRLDALLGS